MKTRPELLLILLSSVASWSCGGCGGSANPDPNNNPDGGGGTNCLAGVDTDNDGVPDDEECRLGTNGTVADSDGDGTLDGAELSYPKICVATDAAAQRRPPPSCNAVGDCAAGEDCKGLDPTKADTDGDGVSDAEEDPDLNGTITTDTGETDPRLKDTDGNGLDDGSGGLDICRPQGLGTVTIAFLPGALQQVGYDPVWGASVTVDGTTTGGAVLLDDPTSNISALVATQPTTGADARAEATRVENLITAALGAGVTPVLLGTAVTTHEGQPAITSTYRVARATNASALRDSAVQPLTGSPAPGGQSVGPGAEFLVDITTVRRNGGKAMGRTDIILTVALRSDFEDTAKPTAIRSANLINTTGVSESGKILSHACQVFKAERSAVADFIWTVDTSGSMDDDQARLGNTASRFFQQMQAAGVDFRVAVITAGSTPPGPNIDTPGLTFISGSDVAGPQKLCEAVTASACPTSTTDTSSPYPFAGGTEEPTAAAVLTYDVLSKRAAMNEANLNRRFRANAKVVAFSVTDEPGTNDFGRYFDQTNDPQTNVPWGTTYNQASLNNIVNFFKRNSILTYGLVPVSATPCSSLAVADLPRCVIEGNNGAVIPIATALQAEVDAAMSKIVLAVAGATSKFTLTRSPITSTIKVKVRGQEVPRSRASGFDYDPATKSIIFFGTMHRPAENDEVIISYRVWEGSIG